MMVVGLVGGVASGKSSIARMFQKCSGSLSPGVVVIDADALGHRVLTEPAVIAAATQRWGNQILQADGSIDRAQIAKIVFGKDGEEERHYWQQVTHPRIEQSMRDELERLRKLAIAPSVVVLDAALLFEAGWDQYCDKIIFVDVPQKIRKKRALQRGWTAAHFEAREAAQLSVEQKRAKAHLIIDNSGMIEQTYKRVLDVWKTFSN